MILQMYFTAHCLEELHQHFCNARTLRTHFQQSLLVQHQTHCFFHNFPHFLVNLGLNQLLQPRRRCHAPPSSQWFVEKHSNLSGPHPYLGPFSRSINTRHRIGNKPSPRTDVVGPHFPLLAIQAGSRSAYCRRDLRH